MKCQACGAEVPAEGVYCHRCGRKIGDMAPGPADDAAPIEQREFDLWQGAYSSRAMIPSGVVLGLLSVFSLVLCSVATVSWHWGAHWGLWLAIMLALWTYFGCVILHRRWGSRYRLTFQRFLHQLGMLLRSTDCVYLVDVDAIQVVQSLPQRLLGVGTITILTHDVSHPKLILRGIADIDHVFTLLDKARREAASRPPTESPSPSGRGPG